MAPEKETEPNIEQADAPKGPPSGHRGRRSGRGRRGRGRHGKPRGALENQANPSAADVVIAESGAPPVEEDVAFETLPPASEPAMATPQGHPIAASATTHDEPESRSPATISQAIELVSQVVQKLRESLDEMEDVLEMLEIIERQSDADEREIESLRRALRQFQRPRDGGHGGRGRG